MKFAAAALIACLLQSFQEGTTSGFTATVHCPQRRTASLNHNVVATAARTAKSSTVNNRASQQQRQQHTAACGCPSCLATARAVVHPAGCVCAGCSSRTKATALFLSSSTTEVQAAASSSSADTEENSSDLPTQVKALDGINSEAEAHNADRPARKSLKKKGPKGKPLSEFKVGQNVKGRAKTVTSYGAFMDIGAETDGLLHISNLAVRFVENVGDVITEGGEYDVRITGIDEKKRQIALSLLTEEEEQTMLSNQQRPASSNTSGAASKARAAAQSSSGNTAPRNDAVLAKLQEKGWDPAQFVTGTVVNTVDFGAFVRVDASQLNGEVEGELDGLVHISQLAAGRVDSVASVCRENDAVRVRVKSIENRKVSLTMVSVEDEQTRMESRGGGGSGGGGAPEQGEGNKDWQEAVGAMDMPKFSNKPMIVDNRK